MKSLRIPVEHDIADMQNHPEFLAKAGVQAAPVAPTTPTRVSVTMAYVSQEYQAAAGVGKRIKEERERRGWTQQELAEKVGSSQQTINRIERGITVHSRAIPAAEAALGIQAPTTSAAADDSASYFWILSSEVSSLMSRAEAEQQALGSGQACIIGRAVSEVKLTPSLEVVP